MNRFKVGDKVKIISLFAGDSRLGFKLGDELFILEDCTVPFCGSSVNISINDPSVRPFRDDQLELVDKIEEVPMSRDVIKLREDLTLTVKERDLLIHVVNQLINTKCFGGSVPTTTTYLRDTLKDLKEIQSC